MKRWILLGLLCIGPGALQAADIAVGCQRLHLALGDGLGPELVEQYWGTGTPREQAPAAVELIGCDGRLLDRFGLDAPLARLDPSGVRGVPVPTFLVTTDLTADAGSYSGPLTILLQVDHDRLTVATVRGVDGRVVAIRLSLSGKAAWKKVADGAADQFLQVSSRPAQSSFMTSYRRIFQERGHWIEKAVIRPGLWESDGEFPASTQFP